MYMFSLPPHPGCQSQMKVLVGIPDPKNGSCHPGGDWNPGWGVVPMYIQIDLF